MREVDTIVEKYRALEKKSPQQLANKIKNSPLDVVIGPGGEFYIIDGHHHATAALKFNLDEVHVNVVKNYSDLSDRAFWLKMKEKQWVRLKDENGKALALRDLPRTLRGLKDDPYRWLAGVLGKVNGFNETPTPYMQFEWADYLRKYISLETIRYNPRVAVKQALPLIFQKEADHLPGFRAQGKKKRKRSQHQCWLDYESLVRR